MGTDFPVPGFSRHLILNLVCLAGAGLAALIWYLQPGVGWWPFLLVVLPWGARLVWQRRLFHRTPYDWALCLFLLTAGLGVWSAYNRQPALEQFWLLLVGILLFYTFSNWIFDDPRAAGWLSWLLVILGVVVSINFLAGHDWAEFPGKIPRLTTLGIALQSFIQAVLPVDIWYPIHPNIVGGILAVTTPFALISFWMAGRRKAWLRASAVFLLLLVILISLLMTSSRGAWLGLGTAMGLALWWVVTGWLTRSRPRMRRWLFAATLISGLLVLLLVLGLQPGLRQVLWASLPAVKGGSRAALYRDSLALIQDYPIIGGGLNMFMMLHASYVLLLHVGLSPHGHNLYLDLAIAQGLPGLFALFWVWGIFAFTLFQVGKLTGEQRRALANRGGWPISAAAMSLTALAVHGLLDDALYSTRAALLLFIPPAFSVAALVVRPQSETGVAMIPVNRPGLRLINLAAAGVFLAGLLFILIIPSWRSNIISNMAAVRQSRFEMGAYTWPEWPIQDELRRRLDVSPVIAGFEAALVLNPDNVSANRRLGMIKLSLGEYADARAHLQAAYAHAPWDNASRQLLGEALIANGQVRAGGELWQAVDNQQRQLAVRLFWYRHIGDAQRVAWVEEGIGLVENEP